MVGVAQLVRAWRWERQGCPAESGVAHPGEKKSQTIIRWA
jgi:hypothetical protein